MNVLEFDVCSCTSLRVVSARVSPVGMSLGFGELANRPSLVAHEVCKFPKSISRALLRKGEVPLGGWVLVSRSQRF